jgi:superfamily I DNA and RNA helicase
MVLNETGKLERWHARVRAQQTMELNRAQTEAVCMPCNSVLQILAGPGSGKTKVLTHRVCFLLQNGLRPENIILTTFTNVNLFVNLLTPESGKGDERANRKTQWQWGRVAAYYGYQLIWLY